jgi:hypothetical protein
MAKVVGKRSDRAAVAEVVCPVAAEGELSQ